jgi:hypothetical protein
MSGVLQRLIGRATGEVSTGLRPRLPSRFETGIRDTGLLEIHAEEHTRPTSAPSAQPEPTAPRHLPRAAVAVSLADPPSAPLQTPAPQPHDPASPPITAAPSAIVAAPPTPGARTAPVPLLPAAPTRTPTMTSPPPLPHATPRVETPQLRSAPEPLLPRAPASRLSEAQLEALNAAPSAGEVTSAAQSTPGEAAAPEITIHIGRLDISTAAPKPAAPRRTTQSRSLPPLSDYLRGERS